MHLNTIAESVSGTYTIKKMYLQRRLLLTWFNFNPSMDKSSHAL